MACICAHPDWLSVRLAAGQLSLSDLLRERSAFLAIKRQNRTISQFVASEAVELLRIAVFESDSVKRNNAQKIIGLANPIIVNALADSGELREVARGIVEEEIEPTGPVLGGFGQIVGCIAMAHPDLLETSLSFVVDLLPLCNQLPIFLLFDSLLTVITQSKPAADFLRSRRFVEAVVARLVVTDDAENLYRLLIQCAGSWPLQDDCMAPGVLQFATNDDSPLAWRLRVSLLRRDTVDDLVPALPRGIELLNDHTIEKVSEVHVAVVEFVTTVYNFDAERARACDNEPMCRALAEWFNAFPDHSIALRAVCRFMTTAIAIEELREYVFRWFMPLIVRADGATRNQAAFAVDWAKDVKALMAADAALEADLAGQDQFIEFCRTKVAQVDNLIDARPPGLFPPIAAHVPAPSLGLDAPTVHA